MKRGIIYDFDGVIAATYRPGFVISLVQRLGYTVHEDSHQLLAGHWGLRTTELIKVCFRLEEEQAEEVNQAWERHDRENKGGVTYIEGVVESIRGLYDANYVLAIVTSRHRESLELLLEEWGIRDCFRSVTAREDTPYHKPDPRAFVPALNTFRSFGIEKKDVVFVGDTIVDKEAGEAAGIDTILVETGPYPEIHRDSHPHAEHLIIPSAAELPKWLLWAIHGFESVAAE